MSASKNVDAVSNQGEFHASVPGSEPLTKKGVSQNQFSLLNEPGFKIFMFSHPITNISYSRLTKNSTSQESSHQKVIVLPNFSAQTLPPESAPVDSTYQPNPDINNQNLYQDASSTLNGADSADVHTGYGHPGQGQTSNELRHDGQPTSKRQGLGHAGLDTGVAERGNVDARLPENAGQRRLDSDVLSGQRGTVDKPGAEEAIPETAETVARENNLSR